MKRLFILVVAICFALSSCVKPGGKLTTAPNHIYFVMLDKSGKDLIHSIKDNITVSYSLNGSTVSQRLMIYKCQVSTTDTTAVLKYGGYVVTDLNISRNPEGYMAAVSGGGVRTFNFTLNGQDAGTAYFDYWGTLSTSLPQPPPSASFVFDGVFVNNDLMQGVLNNGTDLIDHDINNSLFVYLLKQQ